MAWRDHGGPQRVHGYYSKEAKEQRRAEAKKIREIVRETKALIALLNDRDMW